MKKKILFIFLIFLTFLISNSLAVDTLDISGALIPLIDGATHMAEKETANANVETFVVDKPLAQVVAFYSSFLKENGFLLIGEKIPADSMLRQRRITLCLPLKYIRKTRKPSSILYGKNL